MAQLNWNSVCLTPAALGGDDPHAITDSLSIIFTTCKSLLLEPEEMPEPANIIYPAMHYYGNMLNGGFSQVAVNTALSVGSLRKFFRDMECIQQALHRLGDPFHIDFFEHKLSLPRALPEAELEDAFYRNDYFHGDKGAHYRRDGDSSSGLNLHAILDHEGPVPEGVNVGGDSAWFEQEQEYTFMRNACMAYGRSLTLLPHILNRPGPKYLLGPWAWRYSLAVDAVLDYAERLEGENERFAASGDRNHYLLDAKERCYGGIFSYAKDVSSTSQSARMQTDCFLTDKGARLLVKFRDVSEVYDPLSGKTLWTFVRPRDLREKMKGLRYRREGLFDRWRYRPTQAFLARVADQIETCAFVREQCRVLGVLPTQHLT